MTIASLDDYVAAAKQNIEYARTASRTTVLGGWFSIGDLAGQPGAVALAESVSNGAVPTDADAKYPTINAFAGGASGYLTRASMANTVATRLCLFDRLCVYGSYLYNSGTTNPSNAAVDFSGRLPGGDYKNTELWLEFSTALVTGTVFTVTVGYTNQDNVSGRSTGAFAVGAAANGTLGRSYQLPLQAGDTGIKQIDSVTISHTGMTAGAIVLSIMRPLAYLRVPIGQGADAQDLIKTGMPQVFADSALYPLIAMDSTSSGLPDMTFEIASK